jgi:hypothetical protein
MMEVNERRGEQNEGLEVKTSLKGLKATQLILITNELYHLNGYMAGQYVL